MNTSSMLRTVLPLLLACGCASVSSTRAPLVAQPWQSTLHTDHPLVGRIWDVEHGQWVDEAAMLESLGGARDVLLGEKHDNPDHHRLQAAVVTALAEQGRKPVLAFEMLDVTQQPAVDAALAKAPKDADALATAVDWARSGWPAWALYRPVFVAGLEAGLPIVAANLPRAQVRALVMKGPESLDAATRQRLGLDTPLPESVARLMRDEMRESHCGELPEEMLEPMVLAQRTRDGQMADRMLSADTGQGAILITGAGHARTDRGVPAVLARRAPERRVLSVGLVEVEPGHVTPEDYGASFGTGKLPFDFVWFTPAPQREDPCAALRERKAR
ncbi:ChaN family lipoprotein [Myxococcaceae bacterium GXIMD 01537]